MIPVTYSARVDTLTMPIVIIGGRSAGVLHPRPVRSMRPLQLRTVLSVWLSRH
jgi:hypothetical protein